MRTVVSYAFLLTVASAWVLDDSCQQYNRGHEVENAVQEAVNMVKYAMWRKDVDQPLGLGLDVSPVAEQLVGDFWTHDFPGLFARPDVDGDAADNDPDKIERVERTFGNFGGRWDPNHAASDTTLILKCGRGRFTQLPSGRWTDPQFSGTTDYPDEPCTDLNALAITYNTNLGDTGQPAGPFKTILLCDNVLRLPSILGPRWSTSLWTGQGFDIMSRMSWSQTLVHEAIHAIHWPKGRIDSNQSESTRRITAFCC